MGALGIWLNFLVKYAYNNYEHKANLFSVIPIPLYAHPIILYAICCVLSGSLRYDGMFGMIIAVIECVFFNSGIIAFTKDTYTEKQKFAENVHLADLDCWQHTNPRKIIEN